MWNYEVGDRGNKFMVGYWRVEELKDCDMGGGRKEFWIKKIIRELCMLKNFVKNKGGG